MSVPNVITGVNAVVSGFNCSGSVEIQREIDSGPIQTAQGEGGIDRVAGNVDFTGKIMAFGYKPPHLAFPNQEFSLSFTTNGNDNVSCAGVRCTALEIMVPPHDRSGRNCIFYVVHFGADGTDLSFATTGGPAASNVNSKYSSKNLATYLSMGTGTYRQTNCQWQHLIITAEIERKVNSDSNGVYFRAPGNLDWSYTYEQETSSPYYLPALNSISNVVMQTNPQYAGGVSTGAGSVGYWLLSYGIVDSYKTLIDHASRLPIAYQVTLKKCDGGGTSIGSITDPDATSMYPVYNG
jgi:hypothetical protein